jgi:hypothetical protein
VLEERERRIENMFSQNEEVANCLLKLENTYAINANERVIEKGKSAEIEELRKLISMMLESKKEKKSEPNRIKQVTYVPKVSKMLIRSEDEIKKLELTYPKELIDFYLRDEGSVLLIKGMQGCGRTIFSLQFVEDWSKPEFCYYFSTRRNEDLRKRHSWIEDAEMRANALFTQEDAIESIIEESEALREKGERGVFLFNRYEKFCEKNKLEPSSFLELLRIEVAKKNNVAVICILDSTDTKPYDELADGILLFKQHRRDNADEFLGQLEIKELEDVEIKMNKYMYNLQEGKFAILKGVGYQ